MQMVLVNLCIDIFFSSCHSEATILSCQFIDSRVNSIEKTSKSTSSSHSFYSESIVTDEYNILHKDDDKGIIQKQRLSTFGGKISLVLLNER